MGRSAWVVVVCLALMLWSCSRGLVAEGTDDRQDVWTPPVLPDILRPGQDRQDAKISGLILDIRDLQDEASPLHPQEGTEIHLREVVVTAVGGEGAWVEDQGGGAFSGISLLLSWQGDLLEGDMVDVTGWYQESNGLSQVEATGVDVVSQGWLVEPVLVGSGADIATGGHRAEELEGVLVSVVGPDLLLPSDERGIWVLEGGLLVDDLIFAYSPPPGVSFQTVTGVLHFSYDEFRLLPRRIDDIVVIPSTLPDLGGDSPGGVDGGMPDGPALDQGGLDVPERDDIPQRPLSLVINEVLYDTPGTDEGTFIELMGEAGASLDGARLEAVNGANGDIYAIIALEGHRVGPDGLFVVATDAAVGGADMVSAQADLQNGPDSLRLLWGEEVLDALGYGDFAPDHVFAGEGRPAQGAPSNGGLSLARPTGSNDRDDNLVDFAILSPTPGAANPEAPVDHRDVGADRAADVLVREDASPPEAMRINEIYYNSPGTDVGAFIELWGPPGASLAGCVLVAINGAGGEEYATIALSGALGEDSFFVVAQDGSVAGADLVNKDADLQNGPDNLQLICYGLVLDAVGYGDFAGATFAGEGQPVSAVPSAGGQSLGRLPDGDDSDDNSLDFQPQTPSPRGANG